MEKNSFMSSYCHKTIKSDDDYLFFLEADRLSLGYSRKKPRIIGDETWRYQRLLRKLEYYKNCKKSFIWKPVYYWNYFLFYRLSIKLGFTIMPNIFGPGLAIVHRGTIVVSDAACIGANCRIHTCVNIGTSSGQMAAPVIGDNVYIAPGVKIFGDIQIADNIAIGANAVVNKSFLEPNITIAGIPAKKISNNGSKIHIKRGTEEAVV